MSTELNQLFAAYYVASKFATQYENLKKQIGGEIQQHIKQQVTISGEKLQSISAQTLNGQRDGVYRVLFGGASALAYYEEQSRSVATFKYFDGVKKSKSFKLREKEELAAIFGVKIDKKVPSHIINTAIVDELIKCYPKLSACGIANHISHSLVATRKQDAPTIEDAIKEIKHWLILKKIDVLRNEIAFQKDGGVPLYSEIYQKQKLAEELKDFVGGCIRGGVDSTLLPANEYINAQATSRINYNREILKELVEGEHQYSGILSEVERSKNGVELRWCGCIDQIESGYLPQALIDQLKSAQTPAEEKQVKLKLTQQVFFRNNPTIPITNGFKNK